MVEPRRRSSGLEDLTADEAAALGILTSTLANALRTPCGLPQLRQRLGRGSRCCCCRSPGTPPSRDPTTGTVDGAERTPPGRPAAHPWLRPPVATVRPKPTEFLSAVQNQALAGAGLLKDPCKKRAFSRCNFTPLQAPPFSRALTRDIAQWRTVMTTRTSRGPNRAHDLGIPAAVSPATWTSAVL